MKLRYTIILAILAVTLLSFVLTGVYFLYHYKKESEIYHLERLRRKEYSISASISHHLNSSKIPKNPIAIARGFSQKICEISDVHNVDIAFYDLSGRLLTSSTRIPDHDRKLFPLQLDSALIATIKMSFGDRYTLQTKIDDQIYLYDYFFLYDELGNELLIINIPYLLDQHFFNREMKNFFINLVQIYAILFLIAIGAATFLAHTITKPLYKLRAQVLANDKIQDSKPITGKYPSEIQELVDDYNRVLLELKHSAEKLADSERDSAWRDVARQVAHEIKNPLTPMRLNVQWIERSLKTSEPEKLKEFCESMITQIDTLSRIADTFSRYSKLPDISFERVDLCEIARQTGSLITDHQIEINTPDTPVYITGDKGQIIQALNNLLKNALQATENQDYIKIQIEVSENQYEATISVHDNGCGIDEELKDKIFIPRFTTKTSGMGLGLAIVKNIVEAHGGHIDLQSTRNKGTTFTLHFPKTVQKDELQQPTYSEIK